MQVYRSLSLLGRARSLGLKAGLPPKSNKTARTFRQSEDGSATVLTLFIFIVMMLMAGIGIDMMRFEMERARLQATLDAAVLAGAGAPFGEDPEAIVQDYFDKAELSEFLNEFEEGDVQTSFNASKVTASAEMTMDTYLMQLSGVESLTAVAASTAETRIPKLEIALVLDVSNSMNNNSKIGNLRTAAREFVTTILNSADDGNAVISIVPFSTSVAPSQEIYDALLVDERHEYSNCLVFDDDDYNSTALVTDAAASTDITLQPIDQAIYTSRFGNFDDLNQSWRSCYTEDGYRIRPFSSSETQLHGYIDAMIADGNTTGSLGMKWGAALLDPTFRDVTTSLISSGTMDASLNRIPVDYDEGETVKVIVMMGDGENTTTYFLPENSAFRGDDSEVFKLRYTDEVFKYAYYIYNSNYRWYGASNEWRCSQWYANCIYESEDFETFYIRDEDNYYGPGLSTGPGDNIDPTPLPSCDDDTSVNCDDVVDELFDGRWYVNTQTGDLIDGVEFVTIDDDVSEFVSRRRLSWEEAWGLMSPDEYGDLTGDYTPYNQYENSGSNISGSQKDTRMSNVCTASKGHGVVIYTIGFEIGEGSTAESALQGCATSNSHYYRVDGVDITSAFSSIAGNVQSLRLTQ